MKKVLKGSFSTLLALFTLAACTKELPYQYQQKQDVQDKGIVDTNAEYIWSGSVLNISRSSSDALPFSFDDTKRIKFVWTEFSLQVIQTERDSRYQGNETNDKLVLDIPVDYIDFDCVKDKYGECTNSEEVDTLKTWQAKKGFKFKFDTAKAGNIELLPILDDKAMGGKCYDEVNSKLVGLSMEKDAINIQIQRTFTTNLKCLSNNSDSLADATVSAVYQYSAVKTTAALSKDFKTVNYPVLDQDTFGFFGTDNTVLDTDNNNTVESKVTVMNHWNPNRKVIDYYLSDEFSKSENSVIRGLTYKTVDSINDGLSQAGAQFKIVLHDGDKKVPGDIRNSMIVLVEDPVASNVIGYGPQTEDPVTGEIISARTIMFLGTIKKFIRYDYDEIVREKRRLLAEAAKAKATPAAPPAPAPGAPQAQPSNGLQLPGDLLNRASMAKFRAGKLDQNIMAAAIKARTQAPPNNVAKKGMLDSKVIAKQMKDLIKNYRKNTNDDYRGDIAAQYKYLQEAKNCSLGKNLEAAEGFGSATLSPRLLAKFPDDAKPFEQLSEAEKKNVISIILPEIWIPTLIHEMGHNLGLRHNFQGSEDKANFYSDAEVQAKGIDHSIPFSSVMEYGDDFKALPVMGKYDIAALRFAYQQKVEGADGKMLDVKSSLAEMKAAGQLPELKDYGYCTDENTGINAGCRRFDLGTTYTEIAQYLIQNYNDTYDSRNFRHDRANMSLGDDASYGARIYSTFMDLRTMQEVYERIKYRFKLADDAKEWEQEDFLKDLKQASYIAAQFLMKVVTTPDLSCVIAQKDDPTKIAGVDLLSSLDASQISCEALTLNPKFIVIGHFGKLMNSRKDPNSDNPYADQIDVRGYWLDKVMAERALFRRQLRVSTFDGNSDNYANRADVVDDLQAMSKAVLLNRVSVSTDVQMVDGTVQHADDVPVDLFTTSLIAKPLYPFVAKQLGTPDEATYFSGILADQIALSMVSGIENAQSGKAFSDAFKVNRIKETDTVAMPADAMKFTNGSDVLIATKSNSVAFEALQSRDIVTNFTKVASKVTPERINTLLKAKLDGTAALTDMTDDEKVIWAYDADSWKAFASGSFSVPQFYETLLHILPK